jgi:hypothetical protein
MPETLRQWHQRATSAWEPFVFAEMRFSTGWGGDDVPGLAACDELSVAARDARHWLTVNPCPDASVGGHFMGMLEVYGDLTSAIAHMIESQPDDQGIAITVARIEELRQVIAQHVKALNEWEVPT